MQRGEGRASRWAVSQRDRGAGTCDQTRKVGWPLDALEWGRHLRDPVIYHQACVVEGTVVASRCQRCDRCCDPSYEKRENGAASWVPHVHAFGNPWNGDSSSRQSFRLSLLCHSSSPPAFFSLRPTARSRRQRWRGVYMARHLGQQSSGLAIFALTKRSQASRYSPEESSVRG